MKKRKGFAVAAALAFAVFAAGCAGEKANDLTGLEKNAAVYHSASKTAGTFEPDAAAGYKKATENGFLALFYSEENASVRVFDKRTGKWWLSNPEGAKNDAASSQLAVSTVTLKGVVNELSSYGDSVAKGQVEFKTGKTLKVLYTFGNIKFDLSDIPTKLTDERFRELQDRAEKAGADGRLLKRRYIQDKSTGIWTRKDLTDEQSKKLKEWFDKIEYTAEELKQDSGKAGKAETGSESTSFVIPVEYSLEDDSVLVNIPGSEIVYPENEIITSVRLLEYFGSLAENEEGWFLVPDGSGAIVNTEKQDGAIGKSEFKIYGKDYTIPVEKQNGKDRENLMPVFGISRQSDGVFAVIEDNDAVAAVNVAKAGTDRPYNTVFASFALNAVENIGLSDDAVSKFYTTSKVKYDGDTRIRYLFLTGENHGYPGMAEAYRNYLAGNTKRKKLDKTENIPLFIETVGSLRGKTSTLGFVHEHNVALTSFEDDKKILEDFVDSGITDIRMILSGWMNNGVDQSFPNKLNTVSVLGKEKALNGLFEYAKKNGASVYPEVLLNTFSSSDPLSVRNQYSATTLGSEKSKMYRYDTITGTALQDGARYIISPVFQKAVAENMISLLKRKNVNSVLLGDIAYTFYSDYNKKHEALRQYSALQSEQIVKKYVGSFDGVMLSSPNVNTAVYGNLYTDLPESSGSRISEDGSVPFYQMVFHGYADYSFGALNFTSDYRRNLLKCIEYGGSPKYRFIYNEDSGLSPAEESEQYAACYGRWKDVVKESYREVNGLLSPVRNAEMVNHCRLSDGVYRTDYDNGYSIYVNYNSAPAAVNGVEIAGLQALCVMGGRS